MSKHLWLLFVFLPLQVYALCSPVDVLVVGDSQTGATWSKSYLGNFLPACLKGSFAMYGRGGTVPAHWMNQTNMDQIETIERTPENSHHNIGAATKLADCQKRIGPMLDAHAPRKIIYQFGGNMIELSDAEITKQITKLMDLVGNRECFFITPTYEMAVVDHRNVPSRNLTAVLRINKLIKNAAYGRCEVLDGVELMKDSAFFDGKEFLKRIQIPGLVGCSGPAGNDNVHVCGAAARDWAARICEKLN